MRTFWRLICAFSTWTISTRREIVGKQYLIVQGRLRVSCSRVGRTDQSPIWKKSIVIDSAQSGTISVTLRGAVAIQRDQPWRTVYEIEQIRNQTIELQGLREELETKRFRHVDQMSEDFLKSLEETLVLSLRSVDLMNALRAATVCFFREAQHYDKMLDIKLAERFEAKVKAYLELFETDP